MNYYTQKLTREELVAVLKTHVFLDPLWDASFKLLIADENRPERLVHFLNSMLRLEGGDQIQTATLQGTEQDIIFGFEKRVRYDVHCRTQNNEPVIVELQRNDHKGYKDRMLFYSAVAIRKEITPQSSSYTLPRIFVLSLMNFQFEDEQQEYHHTVMLYDMEHREVFYDKLIFVYIELPRFQKEAHQLMNNEDRWLYALRTMGNMKERPAELSGPIFESLFESAKISTFDDMNLNTVAQTMIDEALKNDELAFAREKGRVEGIEIGVQRGLDLERIDVIGGMLANGLNWQLIQSVTHVDEAGYAELKGKYEGTRVEGKENASGNKADLLRRL